MFCLEYCAIYINLAVIFYYLASPIILVRVSNYELICLYVWVSFVYKIV